MHVNVVAEIFKSAYILYHDHSVHIAQHYKKSISLYAQSSIVDAHISSISFWYSPRGIISECINNIFVALCWPPTNATIDANLFYCP